MFYGVHYHHHLLSNLPVHPFLLKEWFLFCFWISDCLVIKVPNFNFFLHLVFSKRVRNEHLIQSHFKHTELYAFGTCVRPDALLYAHKVRTKPLKKTVNQFKLLEQTEKRRIKGLINERRSAIESAAPLEPLLI